MTAPAASSTHLARLPAAGRELSKNRDPRRSVKNGHDWQPPEGILPEDVKRVIAAARCERDRLLIRTLWATGGRVSEVLELTPAGIQSEALVIGNRKNRSRTWKQVFLPQAEASLVGDLLLWARVWKLADNEPIFFSSYGHKQLAEARQALSQQAVWYIVKQASRRAGVQVLALRPSADGNVGEPAPIHPHILRHARARQQLRQTRNLAFVQRQLGWSRLQMAYLSIGDQEAREIARTVTE
jgi:site-specific recombinase XerD